MTRRSRTAAFQPPTGPESPPIELIHQIRGAANSPSAAPSSETTRPRPTKEPHRARVPQQHRKRDPDGAIAGLLLEPHPSSTCGPGSSVTPWRTSPRASWPSSRPPRAAGCAAASATSRSLVRAGCRCGDVMVCVVLHRSRAASTQARLQGLQPRVVSCVAITCSPTWRPCTSPLFTACRKW